MAPRPAWRNGAANSGQGPGQEDLDLERTVCRRTDGAAQVVFMHGQVVKEQAAGPSHNDGNVVVQGEPLLRQLPDALAPSVFDKVL